MAPLSRRTLLLSCLAAVGTGRRLIAACDAPFDAALDRQWRGAFDDDTEINDQTAEPLPLWRGDPGDSAEGVRSCLAALGYFVGSRILAGRETTTSVGPETRPMVLAPDIFGRTRYAPADAFTKRAMEILLAGQFRNAVGLSEVTGCQGSIAEDTFWLRVLVGGTSPQAANFAEARTGLVWQNGANRRSIERCLVAWGPVASVPAPLAQIHAMY